MQWGVLVSGSCTLFCKLSIISGVHQLLIRFFAIRDRQGTSPEDRPLVFRRRRCCVPDRPLVVLQPRLGVLDPSLYHELCQEVKRARELQQFNTTCFV